jgi:anti-repressor protein
MNAVARFENRELGFCIDAKEHGGIPVFAANLVCDLLGIENSRDALASMDDDEKITVANPDGNPRAGIPHQLNYVTEAGLYSLILRSRKPEAKAFKRWITHEVLPAIRRTKGYMIAGKDDSPEEILARAVLVANDTISRMKSQIDMDRPKVIFAEAVDASHTSILTGDLAKLLRQNGVEMGQNRLFAWMRDNGYLMKFGESRNMPTQYAMELGLFEIKERTVNNPDGSIRITKTPKITGKGQIYFVNKFKLKSTA